MFLGVMMLVTWWFGGIGEMLRYDVLLAAHSKGASGRPRILTFCYTVLKYQYLVTLILNSKNIQANGRYANKRCLLARKLKKPTV